jgi:DNA-binding transcriptional regulator YhcF (GntR family)
MVQCDMCDEWYHLECVGLTEAQAQQIDKYFCAQCVPPEKKRRIVSEISNAIRSREALSKSISSTPSIVLAAPLQFVQAAPPKRNTSDATCKRPNKKDNTKTKPKENGSSSEEGDGGLVSLSSLARKPWLDGWVTARAFALRYLQEAKNMAIQAGVPLAQARQLPKQLAVRAANRGKRAWRQAEMLLAVQFLKEAGLVETSTKKGTFIKDPAHTFSDLIALVKKVEMPGAGNAKKMKIVDFSSPHADTLAEEDTAISEQGKFCNKQ